MCEVNWIIFAKKHKKGPRSYNENTTVLSLMVQIHIQLHYLKYILFRKLNLEFWDVFGRKHDMKHRNRPIKQVNLFFRSPNNLEIQEMKRKIDMV